MLKSCLYYSTKIGVISVLNYKVDMALTVMCFQRLLFLVAIVRSQAVAIFVTCHSSYSGQFASLSFRLRSLDGVLKHTSKPHNFCAIKSSSYLY
jgi:hypothetical protein